MRFKTTRLDPPYRLINYRPLADVLSAQFLFDLYDQFEPRINVFRFRNVVGIYRERKMYAYAPASDWDYITRSVANSAAGFGWQDRLQHLGRVFNKKERRLRTMVALFDDAKAHLEADAALTDLRDWLIDLYYVALGDVFVLNLVPIEAGLYERLRRLCSEEGYEPDDAHGYLQAYNHAHGQMTVAVQDRLLLVDLAIAENAGQSDGDQLSGAVKLLREHSVGYGSVPRSEASVLAEFADLTSMSKAELRQLRDGLLRPRGGRESHEIGNLPGSVLEILATLTRVGELRDRNKALLGSAVLRRQQLLDIITARTKVPEEQLRYFLLEELVELLEDATVVPDVGARRHGMILQSALALETGDAAANTLAAVQTAPQGALEGIAASRGAATGYARIVLTPDDAEAFRQDEILVAEGTDFHLLEAMRKASAIVTVEGGILSHASVVCRELNIPCVIGAVGALEFIQTGDLLEVDADAGKIVLEGRMSGLPADVPRHVTSARGGTGTESEGNKAETLRTVDSLGVHVAPFEVLGEAFFAEWLLGNGLTKEQFGELSRDEQRRAVRSFGAETAPVELRHVIDRFAGVRHLAIRSSALFEDTHNASFAGILESKLFVENDLPELVEAIKACWTAIFDSDVHEYGKMVGTDLKLSWYVPLMVQEMVPAKVSGVLFTVDPTQRTEGAVVEVVEGGCFDITSGKRCDERLIWDGSTYPASSLLTDVEFSELGKARTLLEQEYGAQLDIEWSVDVSGHLFVHQVRPVSAIKPSE